MKTSKQKLWLATIASYSFFLFFIYSIVNNIDLHGFFFGFAIGTTIVTLGLIINDMIKNKIYNRPFWVRSIIFMPPIALITYMIQRDKLIKLGNKLNTK
ncbi:MAG: hypothetical protein KAH10_00795 [Flavobacteriales bacterium]|nr:hypothetical protein [Flavobacteriales bacterium]